VVSLELSKTPASEGSPGIVEISLPFSAAHQWVALFVPYAQQTIVFSPPLVVEIRELSLL